MQVGGVTINRAFNLPAGPAIVPAKLKIRTSMPDTLKRADVVIVDEISMCRIDMFDAIAKSIKKVERKYHKKIQLVVIGDFCQLPPVITDENGERALLTKYYIRDIKRGYAFQSEHWPKFHFVPIVLDQVIRQLDSTFIKYLNEARFGDHECIPYFNKNASPKEFPDGIYISGTRTSVDAINSQKLNELPGKAKDYVADLTGDVRETDLLVPAKLSLKVGARVYITVNDPHGEYVNGSMATVAGLEEDRVIVSQDDLTYLTPISRHEWTVYNYTLNEDGNIEKEEIGSYRQLPLRLAYAITTHKSQGATFNKVNLDPYSWDVGQLYVALSRVRSIDGLFLKGGIKPQYLRVDEDVMNFYKSLYGKASKDQPIEKRQRGRPAKYHGKTVVTRIPEALVDNINSVIADWATAENRENMEVMLIPHKHIEAVEEFLRNAD